MKTTNENIEKTESVSVILPEELPVVVEKKVDTDKWNPKTELGKKVKNGEIKDMGEIEYLQKS